jgi:peptidoglycan/LPS O-acetylase OafA/YrhL
VGIVSELGQATDKVSTHRHFAVLDGLRGLAAYCVVVYHGPLVAWCRNGWLAVDFFFILSGFVIAHSYGKKLDGHHLSFLEFVKLRFIRLYPMIFIGTAIGVAYNAALIIGGLHEPVEIKSFGTIAAMSFLLIPVLSENPINDLVYPMNWPVWSLFFEIIANILYAMFSRLLDWRILVTIVLAGAVFTVWGGLDVGAEASGFWYGFGRVFSGFAMGLLLYQVWASGKFTGPYFGLLPLGIICFVLFAMPVKVTPLIYFLCLVAFSFVVLAGARLDTVGRELKWCAFLGGLSYPVYLLHGPIVSAFAGAAKKLNQSLLVEGAIVLLASMIITTLAAMACLKYFDIPVREWLKARRLSSKPRSAI